MYQVKDNHAYLDAFAYNQHKTDGHQFKDVLKQYFINNYPEIEKIFAFWPVASSQGWCTLTNRRFETIMYQNHWKNFEFVETDNPLAKSDRHYYGSPFENSRRDYRAYVLNIHSPELTQTI